MAFADEEAAQTPEPGVLLGLLMLGISGAAYRRHRQTD
ncbi:PEP-CTERM sorting domain-containing protein [Coleofasciculus sp. C1-SOL-03]